MFETKGQCPKCRGNFQDNGFVIIGEKPICMKCHFEDKLNPVNVTSQLSEKSDTQKLCPEHNFPLALSDGKCPHCEKEKYSVPELCRRIEKLEKENHELKEELAAWRKTFDQFEEKWKGIVYDSGWITLKNITE